MQSYTFADSKQQHRGVTAGAEICYLFFFFGHNSHEMTLSLIKPSHTEVSSEVSLFLEITLLPLLTLTMLFLCGYL